MRPGYFVYYFFIIIISRSEARKQRKKNCSYKLEVGIGKSQVIIDRVNG